MDSFLIKDVRIFDGEQVLERGSVLVQDGKIAQVSATESIDFNGPTMSKPDHTLIPGLIDAHVHVEPGHESGLAQGLRFAVTTMCDLGNAPFQLKNLRECAEKGDCSDVKGASLPASPKGGWPAPLLEQFGINISKHVKPLQTEDDAKAYVDDRIAQDVDYIKIIHESGSSYGMDLPTLSPAVEKAIVAKAHGAGLPVLAHAMTVKDTLAVLDAGVDGTAHTILDQSPTAELIAAYKKNNAFCNPTLALIASATEEGRQMQERYAHDPRARGLLGQRERDQMCQCLSLAKEAGGRLDHSVETVKALTAAGIDILCGTDATTTSLGTAYGLSLHQELAMLVNLCGFTPFEALKTATVLPAKRLHLHDRGRVCEGLRADLVLVEGNPLENIDDTLNVRAVWIQGKLCSFYEGKL